MKAHGQRQKKNIIYVEANAMNIYAKLRLHPTYGFWEEDFWIFFRKFSISVAMATNYNHRELIQKHFCKTFVKISAVTQK